MKYENFIRESINPLEPYLSCFSGVFEYELLIGDRKRRMLAYVPCDVRESTAGLLILGENGVTADDLLARSGWCEIADQEECKEKMILLFLEPLDGQWNVAEEYEREDGDVAYIDAAVRKAQERFHFCIHESKLYITGCREGGTMANMAAMWNPVVYAGIATVGAGKVSDTYRKEAAVDYCTVLHGMSGADCSREIRKKNIPLPAWIIDDEDAKFEDSMEVLDYWRQSCETGADGRRIAPDMTEFVREKETPYGVNQNKEAYRVCYSCIPGAAADYARRLQRRLWKGFLCQQRRWMSSPEGDLRVTREPVSDIGMEYHYELIDGWKREWYVYLPECVRQQPYKEVPLVLAMHGYTCSGEIYAGNSEWYKVAEKHGFIVVHPTALYGKINMENNCIDPNNAPLPAWNIFQENDRPDDLKFISALLEKVEKDHPVDKTRVYVTGHSWGSLMTQMLALAMPERFAAAAPCSGVFFGGAEKRMLPLPEIKDTPSCTMPIWMFCGEKEGFLIDPVPGKDNVTGFNVEMWLEKNQMHDQIPKRWEDCKPVINGRWSQRTFEHKGMPLVRFTSVIDMPHATMPEMSFRIWKEHFDKFARDTNGDILFRCKS